MSDEGCSKDWLSIMLPADVDGYHLRILVWDNYVSDAPHTLMIVTGGD